MPTTANIDMPYPDESSDASLNVHIAALAGAVDSRIGPYVLDTGWVDCPLVSGTTQQGGSLPQVRRVGKTVYMRHGVSGTGKAAGSNSTVCTVPAGFRPPSWKYFSAASSTQDSVPRVVVRSDGSVLLYVPATTGSYYIFDSAYWLID